MHYKNLFSFPAFIIEDKTFQKLLLKENLSNRINVDNDNVVIHSSTTMQTSQSVRPWLLPVFIESSKTLFTKPKGSFQKSSRNSLYEEEVRQGGGHEASKLNEGELRKVIGYNSVYQ